MSKRSGETDTLIGFIRRAGTQVQRWNNVARDLEKKAKRAKQLALDAGMIVAEISGLDENDPRDMANARRLVSNLEEAILKDVGAEVREEAAAAAAAPPAFREKQPELTESSDSEEEERLSSGGKDIKKRKRTDEEESSSASDIDQKVESPRRSPSSPPKEEKSSESNHDDLSMVLAPKPPPLPSPAARKPPVLPPVKILPTTPKKAPATPGSPTRAAKVASAKKSGSTVDNETNLDAPSSGERAPYPKRAKRAETKPTRGLMDTFRDRKSCRVLKGRDSTLQLCHKMKPRCISFSPTVPEVFATSALDGTIAFWRRRDPAMSPFGPDGKRLGRCEEFGYLDRAKLRHSRYPADMSWFHGGNRLAVLFSTDDLQSPESGAQITASHTSAPQEKVENAQLVIFNTNSLPSVPAFFVPNKPHKKEAKRVIFLEENKLVSVGADHNVVLWDIHYSAKNATTQVLHSLHSSEVHTVSFSNMSNLLYTGGADRRFIAYNLGSGAPLLTTKFESKVTHIAESPTNPNVMLINLCQKSKQMQLYDTRSNKTFMQLNWRMDEKSSPTQYIIPSWNAAGDLIACGAVDPIVNIWDIRYVKVEDPSIVITDSHSLRVLRAEFHPHYRNTLVTLSSDKQLGWHELDIR